jgi:hypothetical protein
MNESTLRSYSLPIDWGLNLAGLTGRCEGQSGRREKASERHEFALLAEERTIARAVT